LLRAFSGGEIITPSATELTRHSASVGIATEAWAMLPKSELYQVRIAVVIAAALFLVIGLSEIRIAWRTV